MKNKLAIIAVVLLFVGNCAAQSARLKGLDFAHAEMQGRRPSMEDAHAALPFGKYAPGLAFFGLYDGHGGALAAKAASEGFITRCGALMGPIHQRLLHAASTGCNRFIDAFTSFDQDFRKNGDNSGTTAVAVLIDSERYPNTDALYIGWVGDSRAVVVDVNGVVVYETKDHKIDDPQEAARLAALGAVIQRPFDPRGILRIAGLAIPRALGDRRIKEEAQWDANGNDVITAVPDVKRIDLTPEHQFMILACDGVWDVMESQDAATMVHKELQDGMTLQAAAQRVRDMAYKRGSTDNISVMVVQFDWNKAGAQ